MSDDCLPGCETCHPRAVLCDRCGAVIPRLDGTTRGNLDGGMTVLFEGWYGGTIDPWGGVTVTLCRDDANQMLRENEWLAGVSLDLRPERVRRGEQA